jgi:membrane protein implicated in regulation of membrane protease activity
MTTIGVILAAVLLSGWLRVAAIVALIAFEALEIWLWIRWRKRRSITGSDTMIGETGRVISPCNPDGQVKVRGQLWSAHCANGARAGDQVMVTAVRGLKLDVVPQTSGAPSPHPQQPG